MSDKKEYCFRINSNTGVIHVVKEYAEEYAECKSKHPLWKDDKDGDVKDNVTLGNHCSKNNSTYYLDGFKGIQPVKITSKMYSGYKKFSAEEIRILAGIYQDKQTAKGKKLNFCGICMSTLFGTES